MKKALKKISKQLINNENLTGDLSKIYGNAEDISGDVSGIYGNVSDISGNVDDCELTKEDRKRGVNISDLLSVEK